MWGGIGSTKNTNIKYVKNNVPRNNALIYSSKILKNGNISDNDYKIILNKGCYYIPNMFGKYNDKTIFNKLVEEIKTHNCEQVTWSKHFKIENPENLPIVNDIVKKMSEYFNVSVCQIRVNYYPDNKSWKPFHKDSHKTSDGQKENFTMGASFGDTRELEFKHETSNVKFSFPQNNGDCFAFTSDVNNIFLHGVPKTSVNVGPRVSVIAWGCKYD